MKKLWRVIWSIKVSEQENKTEFGFLTCINNLLSGCYLNIKHQENEDIIKKKGQGENIKETTTLPGWKMSAQGHPWVFRNTFDFWNKWELFFTALWGTGGNFCVELFLHWLNGWSVTCKHSFFLVILTNFLFNVSKHVLLIKNEASLILWFCSKLWLISVC